MGLHSDRQLCLRACENDGADDIKWKWNADNEERKRNGRALDTLVTHAHANIPAFSRRPSASTVLILSHSRPKPFTSLIFVQGTHCTRGVANYWWRGGVTSTLSTLTAANT